MEKVVCEATVRTGTGKSVTHKLRAKGLVPAVLYSRDGHNIMLQIDAKALQTALHSKAGAHAIVNLKVNNDGKVTDETAMITEVQRDLYQKAILHVDFHRIRMDEKVHATVTVAFHGHAAGEKEGGMVDHVRNEIQVEGLPSALPDAIDIDVSKLAIGESIHVRDLKLPAGVKALVDGDEMIVVVHPPKAQAADETEAADTTLGAAVPSAPPVAS